MLMLCFQDAHAFIPKGATNCLGSLSGGMQLFWEWRRARLLFSARLESVKRDHALMESKIVNYCCSEVCGLASSLAKG